jgi:hypothetical protein
MIHGNMYIYWGKTMKENTKNRKKTLVAVLLVGCIILPLMINIGHAARTNKPLNSSNAEKTTEQPTVLPIKTLTRKELPLLENALHTIQNQQDTALLEKIINHIKTTGSITQNDIDKLTVPGERKVQIGAKITTNGYVQHTFAPLCGFVCWTLILPIQVRLCLGGAIIWGTGIGSVFVANIDTDNGIAIGFFGGIVRNLIIWEGMIFGVSSYACTGFACLVLFTVA